jgi:hypothetical protein
VIECFQTGYPTNEPTKAYSKTPLFYGGGDFCWMVQGIE